MTPSTPAGGAVAAERVQLVGLLQCLLRSSEPTTDADEDSTFLPMPVENFDRTIRLAIEHLSATVPAEAVMALVSLWRNRAARKRECGLTMEAEIDEARADELESLTREVRNG